MSFGRWSLAVALLGVCAWGCSSASPEAEVPAVDAGHDTASPAQDGAKPAADASASDTAPASDAGVPTDASRNDAERTDGESDAAHDGEAGKREDAKPDTSEADASVPDSTVQDASVPDSTVQDATAPDSTVPDAGNDAAKDAPVDTFVCNSKETPATDGGACIVNDAFGVFVAPTGDDASGAGTREAPFRTIGHALTHVLAGNPRVFVCAATYYEQVQVTAATDGVEVFGGLACPTGKSTDWTYTGQKARVAPSQAGFALEVSGVVKGVHFEDMTFSALPATGGAAQSSIAVMVESSTGVSFTRVAAVAQAATDGAKATSPTSNWCGDAGPAADGTSAVGTYVPPFMGHPGRWVFSAGSPGACTCADGDTSTGGSGGSVGMDGTAGTCDPSGSGSGGSAGIGGLSCSAGVEGANGAASTAGSAGAVGVLGASGFAVSTAGGGVTGQVGQGGGGGSGFQSSSDQGAGGGGGAGGCGGSGGSGGQGGGASIAVAVVDSVIECNAVSLTAGPSGNGGTGADGQPGQAGGSGGDSYSQTAGDTTACRGGNGGYGGGGGGGGGGAFGPCVGIAWTGASSSVTVDSAQNLDIVSQFSGPSSFSCSAQGTAGAGGRGGSDGDAGVSGLPGAAGASPSSGGADGMAVQGL